MTQWGRVCERLHRLLQGEEFIRGCPHNPSVQTGHQLRQAGTFSLKPVTTQAPAKLGSGTTQSLCSGTRPHLHLTSHQAQSLDAEIEHLQLASPATPVLQEKRRRAADFQFSAAPTSSATGQLVTKGCACGSHRCLAEPWQQSHGRSGGQDGLPTH